MQSANIPTASYEVVSDASELRTKALARLKAHGGVVVKASGLASGKGVFVCQSEAEIDNAVIHCSNRVWQVQQIQSFWKTS